jgi:CBS domain-containing protein
MQTVEEIMTANAHTIDADDTVLEAAKMADLSAAAPDQ